LLSPWTPQPLLAQAIRLQEALAFLGSSLTNDDGYLLKALQQDVPGPQTTPPDSGYSRSLLPGDGDDKPRSAGQRDAGPCQRPADAGRLI